MVSNGGCENPIKETQAYKAKVEKNWGNQGSFQQRKVGGGSRNSSRGDRRLGNVLYDAGQESVSWSQALKKNGLSGDFYLRRSRQLDELFPWDHLDLGVSRDRLTREFLAINL